MSIYLAIFSEYETYSVFGIFSDKEKLFEALKKAYEAEKSRNFEIIYAPDFYADKQSGPILLIDENAQDIYNYFSSWQELIIYKIELDAVPNLEKGEMIESFASFSCEYPIYKQLAFLDNLKSFIESIKYKM